MPGYRLRPFTKKEEKRMVQRIKSGEYTLWEISKMFRRSLALVKKIAAKVLN
jgi:DNA-directed RNA polymerase sigma subunit (sigma70/sigma32)